MGFWISANGRKHIKITKQDWNDVESHCTFDSLGAEAWDFADDWFKESDKPLTLVVKNRRIVGRSMTGAELAEFENHIHERKANR